MHMILMYLLMRKTLSRLSFASVFSSKLLLFSRTRSREIQVIADVESIALLVAKNTLVGKAIEGTQWEALKPCMTPRGARGN
ncbi:uncharacterized protein A4U43_C05F14090 [Asparagus officinalis]|uniref:Secreted protein n=1 Tax=Asparagus officinalis TaxID=4686 RepID=A0A5P1ERH0_ASPOF|nr:uncharacterized protein A4U43_C05F14090 [Asparagus officinalis]